VNKQLSRWRWAGVGEHRNGQICLFTVPTLQQQLKTLHAMGVGTNEYTPLTNICY